MFITTHLHNNLFIASFQLLGWLLFHPTAWQHFVNQIDTSLSPDFTLSNISLNCYQHPNLRRLRLIAFVMLPILVGLLIGILLTIIPFISWFFNQIPTQNSVYTLPEHFGVNLIIGISYGILICLVGSILSSLTISIPFAIVASVLSGILVGFCMAMKLYGWTIISAIFATSVAGSITTHWYCKDNKYAVIGNLVIGTIFGAVSSVVVGIILLGIVLFVGAGVGYIFTQLWPNINNLQEYAKIIGMAVACGLFLGGYLKKNWRDSLKWGLLFGCLMTLLIALTFNIMEIPKDTWSKHLFNSIRRGTINAMAFSVLFAVPYLLARHFANVWAGVIAGVLSSGGIYLGIILTGEYSKFLIVWGLVFFGLGLSQKYWLSIISYPFELAWNLLVYQAQKRNPKRTINLLSWHSAFWNEQQHLPLFGLETLLVKVYEYDANLGQQAILHLSNTPQNWAVQATQIETNIQTLEKCHTIQDIAQVHKILVVNDDLDGVSGNWLRNFNKNSQDISTVLKQNNYQQIIILDNNINAIEGILTLAGGKQSKEVQRFRTIAKKWLHLLHDRANKLKGMQEIYNPYIVGIPLQNGQDVFIPRPDINARIKRLLDNRSAPPLLLYGQRRTGKTSLLQNLYTQLPDNFIMLFIDCQGTLNAAQNNLSFFYNLARLIINSAKKNYPNLPFPPLPEDVVRSDPVTRFDEWLDAVEIAIGDKTLLFVLDEFITLDNAFNDGRLEITTILGMLRNMIQHRLKFRFLLSGGHALQELQHWASYLINAQTVHMNYLTEDEAKCLIEHPIENFPLNYTDEATKRVIDLTNNLPVLIQALCGELISIKDKQTVDKRLFVQIFDVEMAIPSALEHSRIFFDDIEKNQVDKDGRIVLKFMASQGEGAIVSREKLATLNITDQEKTIELLLLREIIEVVGDDGYCFQIELVRRWFLSEKL
ncbi:MFS transporter [Candidatus Halobeggiatoa sp. HSG11]|nr:MFS transporter [Candidatus Halobeggiatoa sp. HSG11]